MLREQLYFGISILNLFQKKELMQHKFGKSLKARFEYNPIGAHASL